MTVDGGTAADGVAAHVTFLPVLRGVGTTVRLGPDALVVERGWRARRVPLSAVHGAESRPGRLVVALTGKGRRRRRVVVPTGNRARARRFAQYVATAAEPLPRAEDGAALVVAERRGPQPEASAPRFRNLLLALGAVYCAVLVALGVVPDRPLVLAVIVGVLFLLSAMMSVPILVMFSARVKAARRGDVVTGYLVDDGRGQDGTAAAEAGAGAGTSVRWRERNGVTRTEELILGRGGRAAATSGPIDLVVSGIRDGEGREIVVAGRVWAMEATIVVVFVTPLLLFGVTMLLLVASLPFA
ncbi:hypothetical protein OG216_33270 [Streptomycetaceae bacterium NBC_01309]